MKTKKSGYMKWLVLGGILACVAGIAAGGYFVVLPSVAKSKVEDKLSQVSNKTGLDLHFDRVSINSADTITLHALVVGDRESPLLSIEEVVVRVDVWDAAFGRINIQEARIVKPQLRIHHNGGGSTNLDALKKLLSKTRKAPAKPAPLSSSMPALVVVEQGRVTFSGEKTLPGGLSLSFPSGRIDNIRGELRPRDQVKPGSLVGDVNLKPQDGVKWPDAFGVVAERGKQRHCGIVRDERSQDSGTEKSKRNRSRSHSTEFAWVQDAPSPSNAFPSPTKRPRWYAQPVRDSLLVLSRHL